jgi:hypothetical protein
MLNSPDRGMRGNSHMIMQDEKTRDLGAMSDSRRKR